MEKPSTKKPMNVLKTMVFLKNFMKINFIPKDEKDCLFCKYSYPDDLYLELRCKLSKKTCPSKITINKKGEQNYRNPICKNFVHDKQIK